MDYFEKITERPAEDLAWNIPEQKQGIVNIIGGNSKSFRTEVKVAEYLDEKYPVKEARMILPKTLKASLPNLPNLFFLEATESGSFASSEELVDVINTVDYNLLVGDLSKNTITAKAVASACGSAEKPLIITRDAVDLVVDEAPGKTLMNERIIWFASVAQLQKLLRAVYYPKMLLLSQSLVQVAEVLHKFTLSYPAAIITLHNEQIMIARNGLVKAVPLAQSGYAPIMLWQGELAAKIAAMNLYNPDNFICASVAAIFQ